MLPTFLIIGAQKCGTSALYDLLAQHPDVYMAPHKEPHFFAWFGRPYDLTGPAARRAAWQIVHRREDYEALFDGARPDQARGEASTGYMQEPVAAGHIADTIPDVRLIAVLRDPVARAWSAFHHARRDGVEPLDDLLAAVAAEPERIQQRWRGMTYYVTTGLYARALRPFLQRFPPHQLRLYLLDDLRRDPTAVLRDMFDHIGVDPDAEIDTARRAGAGRIVRSPRLDLAARRSAPARWLRRHLPEAPLRRLYALINQRPDTGVPTHVRRELAPRFAPDIAELSALLGRDLSAWLHGGPVPPAPDGTVGHHPRVTR